MATLLWIANGLLVVFGLAITRFQSHAIGIFLVALAVAVYVTLRHVAAIELLDTGLRLRRVYGYQVLGALEDLPDLVKKHHVSGIIITAILSLESQIAVFYSMELGA